MLNNFSIYCWCLYLYFNCQPIRPMSCGGRGGSFYPFFFMHTFIFLFKSASFIVIVVVLVCFSAYLYVQVCVSCVVHAHLAFSLGGNVVYFHIRDTPEVTVSLHIETSICLWGSNTKSWFKFTTWAHQMNTMWRGLIWIFWKKLFLTLKNRDTFNGRQL